MYMKRDLCIWTDIWTWVHWVARCLLRMCTWLVASPLTHVTHISYLYVQICRITRIWLCVTWLIQVTYVIHVWHDSLYWKCAPDWLHRPWLTSHIYHIYMCRYAVSPHVVMCDMTHIRDVCTLMCDVIHIFRECAPDVLHRPWLTSHILLQTYRIRRAYDYVWHDSCKWRMYIHVWRDSRLLRMCTWLVASPPTHVTHISYLYVQICRITRILLCVTWLT